ncbi:IPTL-CTERM sorting domain-containing protein [Halomonas denitrificans]|nr:IPTL-CTERM sorting domain-containing protein [Halomonas denitrificans]
MSGAIRPSRLHAAVREALSTLRRPTAWASLGLAAGGLPALPALALDEGATATATVSDAGLHRAALVVVDAGVAEGDALLAGLPSGARVIRLPGDADPLGALTALVAAHPGTRELHLVTHGAPGELRFAGGAVTGRDLARYAARLETWFGDGRGGIVLYGCDVASGASGSEFIEILGRLTGVPVWASDDPTGDADRGGDWTLERSTVLASRAPIFGDAARAEFTGLLGGFTVTDGGDSGPGTLRQAVLDANAAPGPDSIDFDPGLSGSTITLTTGEIDITDDLQINGPGAPNLTISGNDDSRIFDIAPSASEVTISGLTLTEGFAYNEDGGAIHSLASSRLTIADSVITGNQAYAPYYLNRDAHRGGGYGGGNGGGVAQFGGELVITGTTVSNNQAKYDGGGVLFNGTYGDDLLQIDLSTITGNTAGAFGGVYYGGTGFGGGISIDRGNYGGTLTISNTTIASNSATTGGGLSLYADALSSQSDGAAVLGTLTISNSTVQDNTARRAGGGLFLYGEEDINAILISDSQILDNQVQAQGPPLRGGAANGAGGGLLFSNDYGLGSLTVRDTTISGNSATVGAGALVIFESYGSTVLFEDSTISANTATAGNPVRERGGATYGFGGGLALFNEEGIYGSPYGSLTLRDTTISGNSADNGGGGVAAFTRDVFGGPVRNGDPSRGLVRSGGRRGTAERERDRQRGSYYSLLSEVTVEHSTISGNDARFGGGIAAAGRGTRGLLLLNSTVSGNSASDSGGAIDLYGTGYYINRGISSMRLDATFATIASNTSTGPRGGNGVGGIRMNGYATADLRNSIVADNGYDISGFAYADSSLIEDDSQATIVGNNTLTGIDPQLGPLQDNGGPTETQRPDPASPVIDAANPAFASPPDFDQRGAGFPRVVGAAPDMGAVEGELPPNIAIAPDPLDFGVQKVGETSAPQSVTISNTGGQLDVSAVSAAGGSFAAAGGTCGGAPFSLADGESCTLDFTFTPIAVGVDSLNITLTTNDGDGPDTFLLTGEGALGELDITPAPVEFGNVTVGSTSAPQSATLENIGVVDVVVSAIEAAAAPFAAAGGSCGAPPFTLAPTATCTVDYTFTPAVVGPATQTLDVTSDGSTSPDPIDLSGTGVGTPTVGLSTNDVDFGTISLGVGGTALVTLTNTGTVPLDISSITDPAPPFSLTFGTRGATLCSNPPFTLSPSASCDLQVGFDPVASGAYASSFDILSNAPSSPDTVNLQGSAGEAIAIPTLGRWGLMLLGGVMGLLGWLGLRRRGTS